MKKYPRNLHALFVPWCVVVNFVFCNTVSVRCTTYIMSWVQLYSEYISVLDPFLASRTLLSTLTARCLWRTVVSIDGPISLTHCDQHWRPDLFDTLWSALTARSLWHTVISTDGPFSLTHCDQHWRPVAFDTLWSALTARSLWHTVISTDGPFSLTHYIQDWRPVVFDALCLALAALIPSSHYLALAACCLWRSIDELCQKCNQVSVLTLWISGTSQNCGQCFFFYGGIRVKTAHSTKLSPGHLLLKW